MKLFVNDVRSAPDSSWEIARNYKEAINILESEKVDVLSLDHDLGEDLTGYDIINWLERKVYHEEIEAPGKILVHSANPVGVNNIKRAINSIERFKKLI